MTVTINSATESVSEIMEPTMSIEGKNVMKRIQAPSFPSGKDNILAADEVIDLQSK
jgi:hypothetical protein